MAVHKSEGLILRVIPFRETSRILTAYTKEDGVVSLLAKGVRGPKPRFGGALEILALSDLVYYVKSGRELQLLSQASLLDAFLGLSTGMRRYAYATGVCEFLLKLLKAPEPPGRLYPLSLRTLECLGQAPEAALDDIFRAFQIKAMAFLGHKPELQHCVECGKPIQGGAGFSPFAGGTVGRECRGNTSGVRPLTENARQTMIRWMNSPLADLFSPSPPVGKGDAAMHLESFLVQHVDRYERLWAMKLLPSRTGVAV